MNWNCHPRDGLGHATADRVQPYLFYLLPANIWTAVIRTHERRPHSAVLDINAMITDKSEDLDESTISEYTRILNANASTSCNVDIAKIGQYLREPR